MSHQPGVHEVRTPGRVNLIGEHIDYLGLPVLPVAIQRQMRLAFSIRDDSLVSLGNAEARFPAIELELTEDISPHPQGHWANYVKAAAQALVRELGNLRGIDGTISSDIPVAAGLSSSAALVVTTGLALLAANGRRLGPLRLAELFARAERYVGTQGGGMDQAVCLAARRGAACRIDFEPLRVTDIPLPRGWRFVVADSMVAASKSATALEAYNQTARESRQALQELAAALGHGGSDPPRRLIESQPAHELVAAAEARLRSPLRERARHVIGEAHRVEEACDALRRGDAATFGELMNASHASLRDDYEVSCDELDELVALAWEGGATGARLTGAGFGGCIIALCSDRHLPDVLEAIRRGFYHPRGVATPEPVRLFPIRACDGALRRSESSPPP